MGYTISGIIINRLPKREDLNKCISNDKPIDSTLSNKTNLSPKTLSICFGENCTMIFLDLIFYKNVDETESLTEMEKQINEIFPKAKILVVAQHDTSDVIGYSYIINSKKERTKFTAQGSQFLDFGNLNETELLLHKQIKKYIDSKPIVKEKLDNHTKPMSEVEKAKFELIYRDKLLARANKENSFQYLGGSLDQYCIENLLSELTSLTYNDIENLNSVKFKKTKLNFNKDLIADYINIACEQMKKYA